MTKYLQSCYEYIHTLGPYPKIVKCPFCNRNEWRGDLTVGYIKKNGCILCRYERQINLVEIKVVQVVPRPKCRGRYDDLEDVPLNISPEMRIKRSLKNKIHPSSKNRRGFLPGFNKSKNIKIPDNRMRHYQNIDNSEQKSNNNLGVEVAVEVAVEVEAKLGDDINTRRTKQSHYLNLLDMYRGTADVEV